MIRRKLNNEKCGCCCTLKEKLQYLWDHTMGAIKKVNEITPDGDGKFTVEAGQNVLLTPISNGMKISTTGEVSYYSAGDTYIDVDNNDLEISLKDPGQTGGVALHDDLEVVATGLTNLLNGGNVGSDTKPIKIVNGVSTPVSKDLTVNETTGLIPIVDSNYITDGSVTVATFGKVIVISLQSVSFIATGSAIECITIPGVNILTSSPTPVVDWNSGNTIGLMAGSSTGVNFWINTTATNIWTTITLLIQ